MMNKPVELKISSRQALHYSDFCVMSQKSTLGARDFSCAASGFGQAFISDPREKPLDRSAISLMAPNQSQTRLNQFSPDFGRES